VWKKIFCWPRLVRQHKSLEAERDEAKAQLARTEKEIKNINQAIKDGEPPKSLLEELRTSEADRETKRARLSELETTLQNMPSRELRQHQAMAIRLQLLGQVKRRDWRKLSNDEIRRFLIFLFGENPAKAGNGITVRREKGRWQISFKGKVEFYHDISNGRPLFHAVKTMAAHYNKMAKRQIQSAFAEADELHRERVVATRQT
jgi:hypothetical protein